MKVVLFCGGMGTRLREHSDTVPKALVNIGYRPIIWHLMRYYAHFGHKDFLLCLGYRGDLIREYFLSYEEGMTNDLTLSELDHRTKRVDIHTRDTEGWKITCVDTGLHTNVAQRLLRVRKYLEGEAMFLANYADGLSDLPLDTQMEDFRTRHVIASFASVRNPQSFHAVHSGPDGFVTRFQAMKDEDLWINGGFFIFRPELFRYIEEGEELIEQPFERLIAARQLVTFRWEGFWKPMDTFKDKIAFDRMEARGQCPWMTWARHPANGQ
jgi:glucose-1-phosphate cytidylyltransferase